MIYSCRRVCSSLPLDIPRYISRDTSKDPLNNLAKSPFQCSRAHDNFHQFSSINYPRILSTIPRLYGDDTRERTRRTAPPKHAQHARNAATKAASRRRRRSRFAYSSVVPLNRLGTSTLVRRPRPRPRPRPRSPPSRFYAPLRFFYARFHYRSLRRSLSSSS